MVCYVQGIPVYYEACGTGKPVLCVHGFFVDHQLMMGCLEPVFTTLNGYKRIYVDLPGMGKTPAAAHIKNADLMLDFLIDFVTEIIPNENFLVIGESYGGYMALGLIQKLAGAIDGVMLICPVITADVSKRRLPQKQLVWKSGDFDTTSNYTGVTDFLEMAVKATPDIFQIYERDIIPGVKLADQNYLAEYSRGYGFSFEAKLLPVSYGNPVCILTGRQDHVVGYADAYEILAKLPRATFAILDCTGHNLQIENAPLFNQFLEDWLWRVEAA